MAELLSIVALLAALLALLYARRLHTELDRAGSRLDRYNKALFDAGEELRQLRHRLDRLEGPVGTDAAHEGEKTPNITLDFER
jgi:hypothetical protein